MPGETASAVVEGSAWASQLSVIGMLVTTNDAQSEANTELCDHIPGPPCGNGGVRVPEGAEGYVHIHAGIHGIGDLAPSQFDWRNPRARHLPSWRRVCYHPESCPRTAPDRNGPPVAAQETTELPAGWLEATRRGRFSDDSCRSAT